MKIQSIGIKGFRGYSNPIQIQASDLLVLVGRNDIGKSTVLEALDIFFNEGKGSVKLDKDDINKANLAAGDDCIEISVDFEDLPASIVIDSTNATSSQMSTSSPKLARLESLSATKIPGRRKYLFPLATLQRPDAVNFSSRKMLTSRSF